MELYGTELQFYIINGNVLGKALNKKQNSNYIFI